MLIPYDEAIRIARPSFLFSRALLKRQGNLFEEIKGLKTISNFFRIFSFIVFFSSLFSGARVTFVISQHFFFVLSFSKILLGEERVYCIRTFVIKTRSSDGGVEENGFLLIKHGFLFVSTTTTQEGKTPTEGGALITRYLNKRSGRRREKNETIV